MIAKQQVAIQLQLDVGNTRLKWRLLAFPCLQGDHLDAEGAHVRPENLLGRGFLVLADYKTIAAALAVLQQQVQQALLGRAITTLRAAIVAAEDVATAIDAWAQQAFAVQAQFAYVTAQAAGVTVGYDTPSMLGVDRWLAVLAASRYGSGGFVVVDCGSAVTVDLLSAGQHLGGYIVPGLRLMNRALFGDTARVKVAADWQTAEQTLEPGRNTAAAVTAGLPLMVVGLVQEVLRRQQNSSASAHWKVLLAGGDARQLSALLPADMDWQLVDDLVLDGLLLAAVKPLD